MPEVQEPLKCIRRTTTHMPPFLGVKIHPKGNFTGPGDQKANCKGTVFFRIEEKGKNKSKNIVVALHIKCV